MFRFYIGSMKILLRSQAQYKGSFIMQLAGNFLLMGSELVAVLLLFMRFNAMGQWSREDILFFFGMMTLSFAAVELFGRGFTNFAGQVQNGDFDRHLLRPYSTFLTVVSSQLDLRRLASVIIGVCTIIYGSYAARIQWDIGKAVILVISLLGSCAMLLGLFMIEATVSFKTIQSIEAVNILTYGGRDTCQYPIDIYPGYFRWLFIAVVPYALVFHVPAAAILGRTLLGFPYWSAYITPLAGFAFLAVMIVLWNRAVRYYQSTGS